jgi:hypothetical protein
MAGLQQAGVELRVFVLKLRNLHDNLGHRLDFQAGMECADCNGHRYFADVWENDCR